jgi:hypothetical protein
MARMTALIIVMKLNVNMIVQNICSNVIAQDDVFLGLGNVTGTRIVLMDLMKMTKFANMIVTQIQNLLAKMANVFQFCGNVILITIVAMIVMNQPTFVATKIVPVVGGDVLVMPTIVAFPNGYFVMEKMIVEMHQMN